jgi:hypothetical protein
MGVKMVMLMNNSLQIPDIHVFFWLPLALPEVDFFETRDFFPSRALALKSSSIASFTAFVIIFLSFCVSWCFCFLGALGRSEIIDHINVHQNSKMKRIMCYADSIKWSIYIG